MLSDTFSLSVSFSSSGIPMAHVLWCLPTLSLTCVKMASHPPVQRKLPLCCRAHCTPTALWFLGHSATFENTPVIFITLTSHLFLKLSVLKFLPSCSLIFPLLYLWFSLRWHMLTLPCWALWRWGLPHATVDTLLLFSLLTQVASVNPLASLNSQTPDSQVFIQFSYLVISYVPYIQYV